jgi:hypothetical protein
MDCYVLCCAGLRDLILRNTNITNDELPQDIWTAVGTGGSCANPSAGGSSSGAGIQQRLATPVLNGQGSLEVSYNEQQMTLLVELPITHCTSCCCCCWSVL